MLMHLPEELSFEEGAGIPEVCSMLAEGCFGQAFVDQSDTDDS
jgi:hypothetical protein